MLPARQLTDRSPRRLHRRLLATLLLAVAGPAQAHDTWLWPQAPEVGAPVVLALGTGNRFPIYETAVAPEFFERQGCNPGDSATRLAPLRYGPGSLLLKAETGARSCWVQLVPLDVELPDDKVTLYLKEIQAGPALRAAWSAMQARGVRWVERYTKHARIDFMPGLRQTVPMGLDIVWEQATPEGHRFQVLRDGRPLADLALELQSAELAFGIWRRSDGEGRIVLPPLPPGRWLLRGTDLRPGSQPDTWDSRFVTLSFAVGP